MADADKNIRITGNRGKGAGIFPQIVFTGSSAGTSVLTLEVRDDNTVAFKGIEGDVFSLDYNLSTGTIWSVNDISGFPLLRADVGAASGATIRISEGAGFVGIGQTNPNYKLDVKGWAGFASTGDGSYTVLVENGLTTGNNALSIRAANALRFYNSGNTFFTGFIGAQSGVNTTYTLPTTSPATGTSVLQSTPAGILSWVPMTASSSGAGSGTVAIPGAQYQIAAYYSGTGASVSGSTTFTNNTSTGIVNITHATESTSSTTGALTITGGAGIAKSLFVGTTLSVGTTPSYNIPNNLASFVSTVNSYNQLVIQNKSNGTSASANLVVNNDISTDAANYGEIGMNSSTFSGTGALGATNAVYLAATTGPLVLGTTTAHPIRFVVNNGATDVMYIAEAGTAISVFTNLDLRSQNDIRFFNSGNTFNTALQAGANTVNYTLSLPTAPVGAGFSAIITDSSGQMYFVVAGSGIAFSSATANTPIIRAKRPLTIQFASGFTPLAAGPDNVLIRVPESANDGTTILTYNLRRFQVRVETPSAGSSRLQLERSSTDTGVFTLAASGSSHIGGFGVTITGAGIYLTSVTTFSGSLVTSGNLLRLNWTLLNATHANFSINLLLEEV
jgi:hypothetical protein